MAFKGTGFNTLKFFQVILFSFLTIQLGSWLFHVIWDFPLLQMGWFLFLFLAVIMIISLYVLGKNITKLSTKTFLYILLIFGIIVAMFYFLPKYIPQIFSTSSLEYSDIIKSTINSIVGG